MTGLTKRERCLIALFLTISLLAPLTAEETPGAQPVIDTPYRIRDEIFHIEGRTREKAIKNLIGSVEGMEFPDAEALERFAEERARKLEKLRLFKSSSVSVRWAQEDMPTGKATMADLVVEIRDGAPIIPIPYAFYNSNDGLQAGTILNMPNLGGSLRNLFLMGLYSAPPDANDELQWGNPNFILIASLSGIELGPVSLFLGGSAMKMNQDIEYRGRSGVSAKATALSGSAGITRRFGDGLSDTLSFRVAGSPESELVSVDDPALLAYGPVRFSTAVTNEFTVDSYDWEGNFRDGWKASAGIGWDRRLPRYDDVRDSLTAELEASAYRAFEAVNPGFTAYAFAASGKPELNLGSRVRGIRNAELSGNYGIFLRSGVQTRIARFTSAEIDAAPGLDLFWLRSPDDPDYEDDFGAAVGGELLFLFDSMKSLPIKLGFAWDCRPEARVASGKRLEVDFSFSLSY